MKLEEIKRFLKKALQDPEKYIEIGFAGKSAGIINIPYIDFEIKDEILKRLSDFVLKAVAESGTGECYKKTELLSEGAAAGGVNALPACRLNDNRRFDWKKIDYYVIKIEIRNWTMRLYGMVSRLRTGKNNIYLQITHNQLEKMDTDYIGIGERVDILEWRNEILVFRREALRSVFGK